MCYKSISQHQVHYQLTPSGGERRTSVLRSDSPMKLCDKKQK